MVKRFLTDKKIAFKEVNLQHNPDEAVKVFGTTGQRGVPQTQIGDQWVLGYDPQRIEQLLKTL